METPTHQPPHLLFSHSSRPVVMLRCPIGHISRCKEFQPDPNNAEDGTKQRNALPINKPFASRKVVIECACCGFTDKNILSTGPDGGLKATLRKEWRGLLVLRTQRVKVDASHRTHVDAYCGGYSLCGVNDCPFFFLGFGNWTRAAFTLSKDKS